MRLFYFAAPESIHTVRWLSAFAAMGHEVHLATTNMEAALTIPGVIAHDITVPGKVAPVRFLRRWIKVRRMISDIQPDIVHGHMTPYAAYFNVRPLVMTVWGSDVLVFPKRSRLEWLATGWRLRRCDLVTVDSEALKREVMAFGVPEGRIALVQWGVNLERMRSLTGSPHLRWLAQAPPETFLVLSTRRFEPLYNLDAIVRSVPGVLAGGLRNVCFVFIGGGRLQEELRALSSALGVAEHVRFIGNVPHAEIEECYGGADAYVSVPDSDSTSVSLLEAMAAGLPAVVSDVPSNLEWIKDGWNGYVIPRRDPVAITKAVLRLAQDERTRREFGARSFEIAAERADHGGNMRRMEGLYRSLIERGRGASGPARGASRGSRFGGGAPPAERLAPGEPPQESS